MDVHHHHGFVPDCIIDKIIGHHEARGKDEKASRIRDQVAQQRAALTNRKQVFKAAVKEHKNSLLPDGQVVKVYSAKNTELLSGAKLMRDSSKVSSDATVNEAYDGSAITYQFLKEVLNRVSVDNNHFPLNSYVHYGYKFNNAYWDGKEMVYGDGDGKLFNRFTIDLDVPAHEQAHALTDFEAGKALNAKGKGTGINYEGEAGGINESYSDQIGQMVKQWKSKETSTKSKWLIGDRLLIEKNGKDYALRSMLKPGTAYINHPVLGTDTQIAHYGDYKRRQSEGEEIDPHDGSGVVNRAFAVAAQAYGGNSWGSVGQVYFRTLPRVIPEETFAGLAAKTVVVAKELYKSDPKVENAIVAGWRAVGVIS